MRIAGAAAGTEPKPIGRLWRAEPWRKVDGTMNRHNLRELQNVGLASLGGMLEYFDFQVYVFVAAALSAQLFPPGDTVWKNQVQAFGIFAIGYLVRPIAGMVIAH